jgi:hypothetical protein
VATGFISSKGGGAVLWPLGLSAARLVVRCCGHWVYQQQGSWCCAVATGITSSKAGGAVLWPLGLPAARLVVLCFSHWVHQMKVGGAVQLQISEVCASVIHKHNEHDGVRARYELAFFFMARQPSWI